MRLPLIIKTNATRAYRLATYRSIDPPRFYISDKYGAVFIDNPKVASTSIKQILFPEVDHHALGQEEFHAALERHGVLRVPKSAQRYVHFFVARNPFSRLVSTWRNKVEGRPPAEWGVYNVKFFQLQLSVIGKLDIYCDRVSFEDFAMAATKIPDWMSDRHLASQSRWIDKVPDNGDVRIISFESFAQQWDVLAQDLGLPSLSRLNKTQSSDWQKYYTSQELIDAVEYRYKKDLMVFNYPVPSRAR